MSAAVGRFGVRKVRRRKLKVSRTGGKMKVRAGSVTTERKRQGQRDWTMGGIEKTAKRRFNCVCCGVSYRSRRMVRKHLRKDHKQGRLGNFRNIRLPHPEPKTDDDNKCRYQNECVQSVSLLFPELSPPPPPPPPEPLLKLVGCTNLVVLVKRQRLKEIFVTTPSKGKREILYTCDAEPTTKGALSSKSSSSTHYEDWRLEIIDAFPNSKASKPGQAPNDSEDKTLMLRIPHECPHIFNVFGIKDNMHSILDVVTGQKMSTPVLDAYLTSRLISYNTTINAGLRANYKLRPILNTNFHYLSVHFLPVLDRDQCPSTFRPNMNFFPGYSLDNSVLIAPLYTCKHFYLAVFDFPKRTISMYDPSWHFVPLELRCNQVSAILDCLIPHSCGREAGEDEEKERHFDEKGWNLDVARDCAQQIDEYSCGVYVINFTENVLKGKPHRNKVKLKKPDIMEIRRKIVAELLPTTFAGTRFLDAISS